jgi:hypothetical protein
MRTIFLIATAFLLAIPGNALAAECSNTEYRPLVTIQDPLNVVGGDLFVVNDFCQLDGCTFSIWIYQESNGIIGLQRGDEGECIPHACVHDDGWCAPDTIVF